MKKNKKTQNNEKKMTIQEYEDKYVRRENSRKSAFTVRMLATIIGIFLFTCLFFIALKFFDIHLYAGIAASVVCAALYIIFFIVPLVKIFKMDSFITNVNSHGAHGAKRHNKKVRTDIAKNIIDFNASVDGPGWYDDKIVIEMAASLNNGDDDGVKTALTKLYDGSVKAASRSVIAKSSVKCGVLTAVSQNSLADAAVVALVNLQMVKDIFYLYGFRPSDARLKKIFADIVKDCLLAYGISSANIGQGITKMVGGVLEKVPIIGTVIDSSVQGLTNGLFTSKIGFEARKYLMKEYKLQDILDGIDLAETDDERSEMQEEVKKGLKEELSKKGKRAA